MELVLEHDEIVTLLREALRARGMKVPDDTLVRLRRNNKKGTLRAVFKTKQEREATVEQP
tara:strand:+ start:2234 stop:2413 length:180 start_codon:yes stop_codon:yes gene_type:complete